MTDHRRHGEIGLIPPAEFEVNHWNSPTAQHYPQTPALAEAIRVAENHTNTTWAQVSRELDRLAAVTPTSPAGTVVQTTEPTDDQRGFLSLQGALPARITALNPA